MGETKDTREPNPAAHAISIMGIRQQLSRGEQVLGNVSSLMGTIIRDEEWRHYLLHSGEYRWGAGEFRRFLESPRSVGGCETPIHIVDRLLIGSDAWKAFRELTGYRPDDPTIPNP